MSDWPGPGLNGRRRFLRAPVGVVLPALGYCSGICPASLLGYSPPPLPSLSVGPPRSWPRLLRDDRTARREEPYWLGGLP
jgi:predicted alpha/beta hydrolase